MPENVSEKNDTGRIGRRHHRPQNRLALRNKLNIIFMITAVIAIVVDLVLPMPQFNLLFVGIGIVAVAVKFAEVILRCMPPKK